MDSTPDVTIYRMFSGNTGPRFIAYLIVDEKVLPVRFEGNEHFEVESKALNFWRDEQRKAREREAGLDARREKAAAARAKRKAAKPPQEAVNQ